MTLSPIANLSELAAIKLLETFPFTANSKSYFQKRMPPDIHHLIAQTVIHKRLDLLEKLEHFYDPHTFQTHSVLNLMQFSRLSDVKVLTLLLSVFPHLKTLDLSNICVTQLGRYERLEELKLSKCKSLSNKEFLVINKKFPQLKKLDASSTDIENLEGLIGLPLEELNIAHTLIDTNAFRIISLLTSLKKINLSFNYHLFVKYSLFIRDLQGPQVEELSISCTHLSNACLPIINNNFPLLKKLDISESFPNNGDQPSAPRMTSLEGLISPDLEELNLNGCSKLPAQTFLTIKNRFPALKGLYLSSTQIDSFKGLEDLPLEELNLQACNNLARTKFLKIKEKCPHLKRLNLSSTQIKSLKGLEGLPLEELDLRWTSVPADEVARFRQASPSLKISY